MKKKNKVEVLRKRESQVGANPEAILLPEEDLSALELTDVIDVKDIQSLVDNLYNVTGVPVGILDLKGKALVKAGWQDICTQFHRLHPETAKNCRESDTVLSKGVKPGTFKEYQCKNNMWDMVTPIFIGGKHMGNVFLGQFLYEGEEPDYNIFRAQVRKYGFNETEYLAALDRVPRRNRKFIQHVMSFYTRLTHLIANLSYSNLKVSMALGERKKAEGALLESEERYRTVFENAGNATVILEENMNISLSNSEFVKLSGYSKEEIENKMKWIDFVIPEDLERMKKYHLARRKAGEKPPIEYEFRLKDKKGNIKDIFLKIRIIPNTKKSIASLMDITEHKQSEERIKHLNLVLRTIRNVNQLIVKEKDRERLIKGACNILTKLRSYHSGWIVLLNKERKLDIYAEAGLGKAFLPMAELFKEGNLTCCMEQALEQKDVIVIEDPISNCKDCLLAKNYHGRGAIGIRLKHNKRVYGVMSVSIPRRFVNDREEKALFKEVAEDIALGLHNIELGKSLIEQSQNLKEKIKELNYLFKISTLIEKPHISLKNLIQKVVDLFPSACHYPENICAKIILGTKNFKTKNFKKTIWKESRSIKTSKKKVGSLEIYHLKERPEVDKWAFQEEEIKLIKTTSESLGNYLDRNQSKIQLQKSYQKLKIAMDATIETVSRIIEVKDPYTAGHQQRVSRLAVAIAKEINLSQDKVEGIRIASLIHDIGKIGIPSEILSKSIALSDIEFSLIKEHAQLGYDILKSIDFSYPVAQIVLQHHEKINGSGYPKKLKGDKILMEAKIICVADVVEAMSSHRPYRPALGIDVALEEISKNSGILYDPEAVDICLKLFKEERFKFE
jgi:PAS domain S-box-containing protein/putative nucleotidyltransferase with HDIG domain